MAEATKELSGVDRAICMKAHQDFIDACDIPGIERQVQLFWKAIADFKRELKIAEKKGKLNELMDKVNRGHFSALNRNEESDVVPEVESESRPKRTAAKKATHLNASLSKQSTNTKLRRPSKLGSTMTGTLDVLKECTESEEEERPAKKSKSEEAPEPEFAVPKPKNSRRGGKGRKVSNGGQTAEAETSRVRRVTRSTFQNIEEEAPQPSYTPPAGPSRETYCIPPPAVIITGEKSEEMPHKTDNELDIPPNKSRRTRTRKKASNDEQNLEAETTRTLRATRSTFQKIEEAPQMSSSTPAEENVPTRSTYCIPPPKIMVEEEVAPQPKEESSHENDPGTSLELKNRVTPVNTGKATTERANTEIKVPKEKVVPVTNFFSAEKPAPLQTTNRVGLHAKVIKLNKPNKLEIQRENQQKQLEKEENALKKRQERIKVRTEETRRKREEKLLKAQAAREAAEREKQEKLRMEKEKEERERQLMDELQKKKDTKATQKKEANTQKMKEVEERRMREEQARLQKLKDQEEQLRKQRELIKTNEALAAEQESRLQAPDTKAPVVKQTSTNDYGIDEISESESTDDESQPKKAIPKWAASRTRLNLIGEEQLLLPKELLEKFFVYTSKTPNMVDLVGYGLKKPRSSSAVWLHNPLIKK